MNKITKQLCVAGVAVFAFSVNAQAAITYIDAEEGLSGNTFSTTQGALAADNSTWLRDATSATDDDQWSLRVRTDAGDNFGNGGGDIFQGMPSGSIPAFPELTTRLSGLADGTYDIYVFFWDSEPLGIQDWVVSAGFTSGSLDNYYGAGQNANTDVGGGQILSDVATASASASSLAFTSSVLTDQSNRTMFAASIGTATVTGGSAIDIFIDLNLPGSNTTTRVWYDGVGYEAVPEPSIAALFGLAGLLLILRRRRTA